jgi:hypothetical protein
VSVPLEPPPRANPPPWAPVCAAERIASARIGEIVASRSSKPMSAASPLLKPVEETA